MEDKIKAAYIAGIFSVICVIITVLVAPLFFRFLDHEPDQPREPETNAPSNRALDSNEIENLPSTISNEKFPKPSFLLVLNADQIDSKILLDGKPAKIISGRGTVIQEIQIDQLDSSYSLTLTKNNKICEQLIFISTHLQKVFPC